MSDFRDRFERQLVEASQRLPVSGPPPRAASQRARRRVPRRAVAALAVTAVLGGTALGTALHPWSPQLGDPRWPNHDRPAVAVTAPPADQLALLGVLRRKAVPEDHDRAVRDALKYLGGHDLGVRTDWIRRLDRSGGAAVTLIPVERWHGYMGRGPVVRDALCVFAAEPNGDGGGHLCWRTQDVRRGRAVAALGPRLFGLVPDGVASVEVHLADGRVEPMTVRDNFFELWEAAPGRGGRPPRWTYITWLDAHGVRVAKG